MGGTCSTREIFVWRPAGARESPDLPDPLWDPNWSLVQRVPELISAVTWAYFSGYLSLFQWVPELISVGTWAYLSGYLSLFQRIPELISVGTLAYFSGYLSLFQSVPELISVGTWPYFLGDKAVGCEADHSRPSKTEISIEGSHTSIPPYPYMVYTETALHFKALALNVSHLAPQGATRSIWGAREWRKISGPQDFWAGRRRFTTRE